jgi:hypothetical protein
VINVSAQPCWVLPHDEDSEWIPHYATEAEALKEREPDETGKPVQLARICVRLLCDGCEAEYGFEEMVDPGHGMHLDVADGPWWIHTAGWSEDDQGHDWCPECPVPESVERDLSREPGPDDVPLPGMEPS